MILKYANGISPFRGKHKGAVFQSYASGQQILSMKRNGRKRYSKQWASSGTLIELTRAWRNLSDADKTAWNSFAYTNPHIINRWSTYDPLALNIMTSDEGFIMQEEDSDRIFSEGPGSVDYWTGYAYYLVRNYYERLFKGRNTAIFIPPDNTTVPDIEPTFNIYVYFGIISLVITCANPINPFTHGYFLTKVNSPGAKFPATTPVYMDSFEVTDSPDVFTKPLDLTIPYYRNFGKVPHVGDWIYLKYRHVSKNTADVYNDSYYVLQFEAP